MEPVSAAAAGQLPIRIVALFTSGVAYMERAGEVDGSAAVPLTFRTAQINDLLKSLVLLDEQGVVQPVTYGARDPISRTLQSFAVDVTHSLGRAELLNRLRGTSVTVQTTDTATITGQIVGVEQRTEFSDDRSFTVEVLTLLAAEGLESVRLERVRAIRLLDARLDREFREALTVLASGSDDQRRQVTLHFSGDGRRPVRVGYITESPLWKMSYRLVLGEGDEAAKPYLQGWALVENTTDEDWNAVRLSLVSGRPVSFIQDLYQPLYLPRPVVAPDVVASPSPQVHGSDMMARRDAEPPLPPAAAPASVRRAKSVDGMLHRATLSRGYVEESAMAHEEDSLSDAMGSGDFGSSVPVQAQGQSAGELFRYDITTPVSLPRQQAAMIPVVADDIEGEKLSIFNADTDRRFPLNAVRLRNTTNLHLKGGPLTLFDGGVYAGDGKMEDLPPGDSRLVSYAMDLLVEGERQARHSRTETLLSLKRGVLAINGRTVTESIYTLKSKADKPRTILVEHPFNPNMTLLTPPVADERTASVYRFAVTVPPRQTETLNVTQEQQVVATTGILDSGLKSLIYYAGLSGSSERLNQALGEIVQRRRHGEELTQEAQARESEIQTISADQERIRSNMAVLDREGPLYTRYVGDLDRQETRLQELRSDVRRLRAEAQEVERLLKAYVDDLDIGA